MSLDEGMLHTSSVKGERKEKWRRLQKHRVTESESSTAANAFFFNWQIHSKAQMLELDTTNREARCLLATLHGNKPLGGVHQ